MSLTVKDNKGDFEITPEGTYVARCFKIIDLGTQTSEWNGDKISKPKILVSWELLDDNVKMQDGRPFAASKRYTASLHEKSTLRKDLQNWRGKRFTDDELEGFDLTKVLGTYCQMQIVHTESNGSTYANVDAIMSTREKPKGINELVHFDISNPDLELFETFSDKLKEQIKSAPEWGNKDKSPVDDEEPINLDDIPF